jgi:Tfp pilus assembly protein PilN
MKIRLNLATNPPDNNRPFIAGISATGLVAAVAFIFLFHSALVSWEASRELRRDISQLQGQVRMLESRRQGLETYFNGPAARQTLDRAGFLNSMIQQRSFPWTKLFMDLEDTLPAGVRVISIVPELHGGRVSVKLTFGAMTDESKVKFLQALENSKEFSGIEVIGEKHSEPTAQIGGVKDHVVVDLQAWYETT